ncbi:uncharacterized protein LOC110458569 [Mizuhopecten yessoensis]|uniref:Tumor protein p53-inducible protein 13 n=1 Tax=Mizuhopecten yessoensis TaxID=6573 RepID=A0A210Q6L1_MIZYE|nr:uncharacterized protein LOC110458569 [Mizuhopecten yessoensis]XP_021366002.1 uncharacterized protein LOC110458569 [Mizuhopecten yessoensis]XP_021366003.1 uncharacterized protein LOC110458569 [Mizuhopecten yessoensis]OWF44345.1 hypothetical protein KP79_PYT15875 [Mizuhopecten yessoensis]
MMTSLIIGVCTTVWTLLFLTHISLAHLVHQPDFGDFALPDVTSHGDSMHGGVKMGVLDDNCDNGKDRLAIDLAQMRQMVRICPLRERIPVPTCGHGKRAHSPATHSSCKAPELICSKKAESPIHECMDKAIVYDDAIPTSGAHRPIWPVYGEYSYAPPQRWLHSLEHGAAVFLYHPCANIDQLKVFKTLATTCLRRHIITPYNLTQELPFAVLTWTCRLMLDRVDTNIPTVVEFLKNKTMKTYESSVYQDGDYSYLLKKKAAEVGDNRDSVVCPKYKYIPAKRFL